VINHGSNFLTERRGKFRASTSTRDNRTSAISSSHSAPAEGKSSRAPATQEMPATPQVAQAAEDDAVFTVAGSVLQHHTSS